MAYAVAGRSDYPTEITGIRAGEKIHEILLSEEELPRSEVRGDNFVILPILPELRTHAPAHVDFHFAYEYTSAQAVTAFIEAVRLRRTVGNDAPAYRYERDVEQFFRHSPAVVRD